MTNLSTLLIFNLISNIYEKHELLAFSVHFDADLNKTFQIQEISMYQHTPLVKSFFYSPYLSQLTSIFTPFIVTTMSLQIHKRVNLDVDTLVPELIVDFQNP